MIRLRPATPQFFCCPWCRKSGVSCRDGDNLQLRRALSPEQREPNGFYASWHWGSCHFCAGEFFGVTLTMIPGSIEETQDEFWHYLRLNESGTELGEYDAIRDNMLWPVVLHETPKGPMLQHDFGPYPMRDGAAEFLQRMLIDLWPELRALADEMNRWRSNVQIAPGRLLRAPVGFVE